ncbi:MAG: DUF2141 domain-containing protein [Verrucomicrobiales bacterium]|nr:DUF2141 domain-containing protein [Verrucomicrobiales bacterium]
MKFLLPTLLFLVSASLQAADVEVTVDGVTETRGTMMIGFYTNPQDFRVNEIPQSPKFLVTKAGRITAVARDLKPGIYAVGVVWDVNNNGILDTKGRFKIPTEPYGFSNNPKARFGPPSFDQCLIQVPENGARIHIFLK